MIEMLGVNRSNAWQSRHHSTARRISRRSSAVLVTIPLLIEATCRELATLELYRQHLSILRVDHPLKMRLS